MIDLADTVLAVLRDAGYRTRIQAVGQVRAVVFEDGAVLGFVAVMSSVAQLTASWTDVEEEFLRGHAAHLRRAQEKAWNVYSVFLTAPDGDAGERRKVNRIEENLERTRKIAVCGLLTRGDVERALLPLLPLQHQAILESGGAETRLRTRLSAAWPGAADAVLDEKRSEGEVLDLLRGAL